MLERLAKDNADKVRIVKVDVSKHQEWAVEEKVRGIPTFQIYRNGSRVDQFAGAYPEKYMQKKIDRFAMVTVSSSDSKGEGEQPAAEPAIKPMPKDWLPPGVTRE